MAQSIIPKWEVEIDLQGKVQVKNQEAWHRFKIPYKGRKMHLILKPIERQRSRQEEKYYHGVVVRMIAEEMAISREETHDMLKNMFLRHEGRTKSGIRYERVQSTTELTDREYREYWERVVQWAGLPTQDDGLGPNSGLGLYIPLPNEVVY